MRRGVIVAAIPYSLPGRVSAENSNSVAPRADTMRVFFDVGHPTLEHSPAGVVQLADEALYAAKQSGRNCSRVLET